MTGLVIFSFFFPYDSSFHLFYVVFISREVGLLGMQDFAFCIFRFLEGGGAKSDEISHHPFFYPNQSKKKEAIIHHE